MIITFFTLSLLEILLGVDNLVILSVIVSRLPKRQQKWAQFYGLGIALLIRIASLFALKWLTLLEYPLVVLYQHPISIRDIVFFLGGFFLIYSSIKEIRALIQNRSTKKIPTSSESHFLMVILQLALVDFIFAIDSMITTIALTNIMGIMIASNLIAITLMFFAIDWIISLLKQFPEFKMLAFCFILLVGLSLLLEGMGILIPKSYLYSMIAFALVVQILNSIVKHRHKH